MTGLPDLTTLIPIAVSIGFGIGGAAYARKRGLPAVQAEVNAANEKLIRALKEQLVLSNSELAILRPKLSSAEVRIENLEIEIDRLERQAVKLSVRIIELEKHT